MDQITESLVKQALSKDVSKEEIIRAATRTNKNN